MDNSTLDHFDDIEKSKFADLSFRNLLVGLALYAILIAINVITRPKQSSDYHSMVSLVLMLFAFIANVTGFIRAIKSITRKEKSTKKYFSLIGNLILLLIVCLIIFANTIDVYQQLK